MCKKYASSVSAAALFARELCVTWRLRSASEIHIDQFGPLPSWFCLSFMSIVSTLAYQVFFIEAYLMFDQFCMLKDIHYYVVTGVTRPMLVETSLGLIFSLKECLNPFDFIQICWFILFRFFGSLFDINSKLFLWIQTYNGRKKQFRGGSSEGDGRKKM